MTTPLAQAMLAWLLTYALHSTVLLLAAWLLTRRRVAPAVADVVWKSALVGGLVTATLQGLTDRRPAGSFFLGATATEAAAWRADGDEVASAPDGAESAATVPESFTLGEAAPAVRPQEASEPDAPAARTAPALPATTALAIAWLAVAFALVAWYAGRRLILLGRLGDRRPVVDGGTLSLLAELRRDTRARRDVRLTASASISSPVALGGEICLPAAALTELDPAQRRAMLAHELAHLERRDPEWLAVACVLERAFFFQPLNRLARRGIQENAEYLADAWAAHHSGGIPLAKALVKVAEWMQASPLGVPVAGFAEERSQLTRRVTRLLDGVTLAQRSRWGALATATLALLLTAAFAPGVSQGARGEPVRDAAAGVVPGGQEVVALDPAAAADAGPRSEPVADTDTAIVRAVMRRLRDEDAEVRRAAADALGRMRSPIAIDALVLALDDLDGDVRRAALHALGSFERSRVPAPPIRRMLESPDPEMRSTAVRILAEQRDRQAIAGILRLVSDASDDVRVSALQALGELDAPVPDETVARALADRSADVRETAAHLAGERQLVGVVPQLIQLLEDRSSSVRESAAHALTEMRTPPAHEALRRALTHRDASVRRIAVEYFGEEVDK